MVAVSTCAKAAAFRAVILGAPASGKGTISLRIVKDFGIAHISSGDKLRYHIANCTELGKEVKKYLDKGSLVPDDTMISLISKEIESLGECNWLLDGFPRTLIQAEKIQKLHPASLVLNLVVSHSIILDRVKNRWIHLPSGRVYNLGFNDPKVPVDISSGLEDGAEKPKPNFQRDNPKTANRRFHLLLVDLIIIFGLSEPKYVGYELLNQFREPSGNYKNGKDDVTGEPLSKRPDDKLEVVQKRLKDYSTNTEPVIDFYRKVGVLRDFHGNSTNEIWPKIKECVAEFIS